MDFDLGENLFPSCNRVASLLKRWLIGTHQGAVSHEHLDYYLDKFTFRFNRRSSTHRGKLFYRLLQNAVHIDTIPLKKIIENVRNQRRTNAQYMYWVKPAYSSQVHTPIILLFIQKD